MSTFRPAFVLPLAGLIGCVLPPPLAGCPETASCADEPASTGEPPSLTSAPSDPIQTVTGDGGVTSSTSGAETDSTGEPADMPPAIVHVDLDPNPLEYNGEIAVTVTAEHSDGIDMQLDTGDVLVLDMLEPGVFAGAITAYTALDNGPHVALLTPRREGVTGQTVPANYTIALPDLGSEGYWETGNVIGQGQVAAMGVLPSGHVIELGTLYTNDGPRCYMRRRDKGGAWLLSDVVTIFPDDQCSAIDLKIDAQGAMFVLVNRKVGNETRWWLARISAWGAVPAIIGKGDAQDTAVALTAHPSGMIAACGFFPTPALDDDAFVAIFRPNLPGERREFDYQPEEQPAHWFWERTRDCVFADDTLVLIGEAHGLHGMEKTQRDRLFILDADLGAWNVAPSGVKTQSGAQAVDVDNLGRLVIAAVVCDDVCQPEGELRTYDEGVFVGLTPLGMFPTKQFGVQDLAWSPAGYAVVATGGVKGNETAFTVRAFDPALIDPVWTFTHDDAGVLHMALALAIGKYGEVYAGGFGENGYPAVAYIGG